MQWFARVYNKDITYFANNMHTQGQLASVGFLTAIVLGLTAVAPAFAQSDDYGTGTTFGTYCPQLFQTVVRGSSGNQVLELQKFLSDYYDIPPATIQTGYFGRITQGYVIQFQKEQGLPSYGIAGSMTRAAITKSCRTSSSQSIFRTEHSVGVAPLIVSFTAMPPLPRTPGPYIVEFGDGTSEQMGVAAIGCVATSCLPLPYLASHEYKVPGVYTAALKSVLSCSSGLFGGCKTNARQLIATATITVTGNNGNAVTPSVTLLSPIGGDAWTIGQTYTIRWQPTYGATSISIVANKSALCGETACALISTEYIQTGVGQYTFRLPDTIQPGKYYVRLNTGVGGPTGYSDQFMISGSSASPVTLKPSLISSVTGLVYVSLNSTGLTDANAKGGYVDWGDGSTQKLTCSGFSSISGEGSSGVDNNGNCIYGYLSVHNHNYSVVAGQTYPYTIRLIGTGGELARYQISIYDGMPQYYQE